MAFAGILVGACAAVLAVLGLFLLLECLAALLPRGPESSSASPATLAALVPAHDEAAVVGATVAALRAQLRPAERVLVVADNCSDDTAAVAQREGAEVLVRRDPEHRGKGHALAAGLEHLAADPPDLVAFVDADCIPEDGALERLRACATQSGRPCQAVYLLEVEDSGDALEALSWFAFLLKNHVRPRGLRRLGLPCLLTGTGMVIPWAALRGVSLASGHLVEDMQLAVDLALAGHAPRLCEEARVRGLAAPSRPEHLRQRQRWEHGHLALLRRQVPRLWAAALLRGRPELLALSLEIAVPPLAFLCIALLAVAAAALPLAWAGGSPDPLPVVLLAWAAAGLALLVAWAGFARDRVPLTTLLRVPRYLLWKLPVYWRFLRRREQEWIRTPRAPGSARDDDDPAA